MTADHGTSTGWGESPPPDLPALRGGTPSGATAELEQWEGEPVWQWAQAWGLPELHILGRTTSTNDEARRLAERGAASGTTVIAEEQIAGKGRRGRSWHAPPGRALLLSVVLRAPPPRTTLRTPTAVPIQVGVAVARAVETVAPVSVALKWPNDVLVAGGGKVAGILCEGALGTGAADYVVAGIGINVNQHAAELPADTDAHATSLAIAAGHDVPRAELAGALFAELDRTIRCAGEPLDDAILGEYGRRDVLRGSNVVVDETIRGTANGITRDGGLRIDDAAATRIVLSGTVRLAHEPQSRYPTG